MRCPACDRCRGLGRSWPRRSSTRFTTSRFDRVQECASYARLVKCQKQSAGKTFGTSGAKMRNVHLKRALPPPHQRRQETARSDREETREGHVSVTEEF